MHTPLNLLSLGDIGSVVHYAFMEVAISDMTKYACEETEFVHLFLRHLWATISKHDQANDILPTYDIR